MLARERSNDSVRRRIAFDAETFVALDRLARDRMSTIQELADEAFRDLLKKHTFAKQLAQELYRRVHAGSAVDVVLIADRQTLGQIRPTLHKEVRHRLVREIGRTLRRRLSRILRRR